MMRPKITKAIKTNAETAASRKVALALLGWIKLRLREAWLHPTRNNTGTRIDRKSKMLRYDLGVFSSIRFRAAQTQAFRPTEWLLPVSSAPAGTPAKGTAGNRGRAADNSAFRFQPSARETH